MPSGFAFLPRGIFAVWCLYLALLVQAQPADLTADFGKLSARERARVAREEQENAARDAVYQAVMKAAEELFRRQEFDSALARYSEARLLRPYNVYPKVKIQDLQALLAQREAEKARSSGSGLPAPRPPATGNADAAPVSLEPVGGQGEALDISVHAHGDGTGGGIMSPMPAPVEQKIHDAMPPVPGTQGQEVIAQPSVAEHVYKEGRSIVVETTVPGGDRITVYRKVAHPWGQEHYFVDGRPVPEHAYKAGMAR